MPSIEMKVIALCKRVWTRLQHLFGRTAPPCSATAAPAAASGTTHGESAPLVPTPQPEAPLLAEPLAESADIAVEAATAVPPAQEQAVRAPAETARWLTGVAKNAAGRMMPWVFVPPERKYRLYLPASAVAGSTRTLIVMLHGCRQHADTFARGTRFGAIADAHGFAVLYPDQLDLANAHRCWNWWEARTLAGGGEAAIVLSMIEHAVRRANADERRIVIAGMSSGAALAALLAYQQPARFAGVVVHSGLPPHAAHSLRGALNAMEHGATLNFAELCQRYWAQNQLPPPPLRIIHGDADDVAHPHNARALLELWRQLYQAETPAPLLREERGEQVSEAQARSYTVTSLRAGEQLVAEQIMVHGLGHAWSGGDPALPYNDASAPSASALIGQWALQITALALSAEPQLR